MFRPLWSCEGYLEAYKVQKCKLVPQWFCNICFPCLILQSNWSMTAGDCLCSDTRWIMGGGGTSNKWHSCVRKCVSSVFSLLEDKIQILFGAWQYVRSPQQTFHLFLGFPSDLGEEHKCEMAWNERRRVCYVGIFVEDPKVGDSGIKQEWAANLHSNGCKARSRM